MCEDSTVVKNIHYGDILVRYGEVLKLSEQEIPSLLSDIGAKITTFVEDGDVVIADTAEDLTAGKAVEVQETHGKKVAAGLHTMLCKPIKDCFAPGWLGFGDLGLAQNYGLTLGMRRGDFFDLEAVADGVADMAFAHGAGHTVDGKRHLIHNHSSLG